MKFLSAAHLCSLLLVGTLVLAEAKKSSKDLKEVTHKVYFDVEIAGKPGEFEDVLDPDFGESAIGRVVPVDSGLWWIILLRAYGKITGNYTLQERVDVQTGIGLILKLCLADGFDMFPIQLVTDGSCMIDRRMGIHGHPLEIQALFYSALRCSWEIITVNDTTKDLVVAINNRLSALSFHIREYYWISMMFDGIPTTAGNVLMLINFCGWDECYKNVKNQMNSLMYCLNEVLFAFGIVESFGEGVTKVSLFEVLGAEIDLLI